METTPPVTPAGVPVSSCWSGQRSPPVPASIETTFLGKRWRQTAPPAIAYSGIELQSRPTEEEATVFPMA